MHTFCTCLLHNATSTHSPSIYLPSHTSPPVDQCPIYALSNCTMGLDTCADHSLFGRTYPYYTVMLYSSCGLNKRSVATLAFLLSLSVLSSQYLFQRGPIWGLYVSRKTNSGLTCTVFYSKSPPPLDSKGGCAVFVSTEFGLGQYTT